MLIKLKRMAKRDQLAAGSVVLVRPPGSVVLVHKRVLDMAAFVQAVSSISNLENDKCAWIIAYPKHFNQPIWTGIKFSLWHLRHHVPIPCQLDSAVRRTFQAHRCLTL